MKKYKIKETYKSNAECIYAIKKELNISALVAAELFNDLKSGKDLEGWNLYGLKCLTDYFSIESAIKKLVVFLKDGKFEHRIDFATNDHFEKTNRIERPDLYERRIYTDIEIDEKLILKLCLDIRQTLIEDCNLVRKQLKDIQEIKAYFR
jgi:hypothetical protein